MAISGGKNNPLKSAVFGAFFSQKSFVESHWILFIYLFIYFWVHHQVAKVCCQRRKKHCKL
jgi:hypothetical protein